MVNVKKSTILLSWLAVSNSNTRCGMRFYPSPPPKPWTASSKETFTDCLFSFCNFVPSLVTFLICFICALYILPCFFMFVWIWTHSSRNQYETNWQTLSLCTGASSRVMPMCHALFKQRFIHTHVTHKFLNNRLWKSGRPLKKEYEV